MRNTSSRDPVFGDFVRLVATAPADEIARILTASPGFATFSLEEGATRRRPTDFFLASIRHQIYGGDTALHIAAAAFRRPLAELLVDRGADVRARNRRGAEPLHYAADANHSDPAAQAATIEYLTSAGADPHAGEKSN